MDIKELKDAVAQNKVRHLCLHKDSNGTVTVKVNCGAGRSGDPLLNADGSPVIFKERSHAEKTLVSDYGCSENLFHFCNSPLC